MRIALSIPVLAAALTMAPPTPRAQDAGAMVAFEVLSPDLALELAKAAFDICHDRGFQVAVAVVDRQGATQVVLRDRFAGPHTIATAQAKGFTAVSFRTGTQELDERIVSGELSPSLRQVPGALMLGGGVPVTVAGSIVGGVGVSGAPSPVLDEDCAIAAIDAISWKLPL